MTHQRFIEKYLGHFTDYDGKWGNQCVDLIRRYTTDVLGVEAYKAIPGAPTAKQIFYNFTSNKYFTKVNNAKFNYPKQGDLVFFKTSIVWRWLYGWAGHTAVIHSANVNEMTVLEQNYPTGNAIRLFRRSYKDTLGWLSRK